MEPTEEPTLPFPSRMDVTFDLKCPYCDVSSPWRRHTWGWRPKCSHVACLFVHDVSREWMSSKYEFLECELLDVAEQRVDREGRGPEHAPEHTRQVVCHQEDIGALCVLIVKDPDEFRAWLDEPRRRRRGE